MTRVYLADARREERAALRRLLIDLEMKVVGEAADWSTTLAQVPICCTDLVVVDWDILPDAPSAAVKELRKTCPGVLVMVLISHLNAPQQAALAVGADAFISRAEMVERVAERFRTVAASIPVS